MFFITHTKNDVENNTYIKTLPICMSPNGEFTSKNVSKTSIALENV